ACSRRRQTARHAKCRSFLTRTDRRHIKRNCCASTCGGRSRTPAMPEFGRSVARLEAREKVTGRAQYVHNMHIPGMLHGKIFRSTVAHGKIRRLDVSAARQIDGVYEVITGEDIRKLIADPSFGPAFHDQP